SATDEIISIGNNTLAILADTMMFASLACALLLSKRVLYTPTIHAYTREATRLRMNRLLTALIWVFGLIWLLTFAEGNAGYIASFTLTRVADVAIPMLLAILAFNRARRSEHLLEGFYGLAWLVLA